MTNTPIIKTPADRLTSVHIASEAQLIRILRQAGVRSVLWKGRSLDDCKSVTDSDIDILIHADDKSQAEHILTKLGFIRLENAHWRSQPCIDDWYSVDQVNGALLHVQLYDQLVLGSYASAQIIVPGATQLFNSKSEFASDAYSAVIRICRAAIVNPLHPGRSAAAYINEVKQLSIPEAELLSSAIELFGAGTAKLILEAYSTVHTRTLKSHLRKHYRHETRAGGEGALAHVYKLLASLNRKFLGWPLLPRRELDLPAPIVAVIGSDGSGKSTTARESVRRFDKKIDANFVYFGTGEGSSSLLRIPLIILKRARSIVLSKRGAKTGKGNTTAESKIVPHWAKAMWAISVALERRNKMRRVKRHADRGFIIITDRYPQDEFSGIHDGPRLSDWLHPEYTTSSLLRSIANWENRVYKQLAVQHPSLLILLDIDLDTAADRRPEETREELERRINVAQELRYGNAHRVVINSAQPLNRVIGSAMQEILRHLER